MDMSTITVGQSEHVLEP